jgi:hypothetical protein
MCDLKKNLKNNLPKSPLRGENTKSISTTQMGVVRPREAFRIPPTPSICVVTRAPREWGWGEGTTLLLVYLVSSVSFLFVCLLVVFFRKLTRTFSSVLSSFAFPYLLTVVAVFFVYRASQLLRDSTFLFLVCFGPFFSLLSARLLHCLPLVSYFVLCFSRPRSRQSCGERERGVFLLLVMD